MRVSGSVLKLAPPVVSPAPAEPWGSSIDFIKHVLPLPGAGRYVGIWFGAPTRQGLFGRSCQSFDEVARALHGMEGHNIYFTTGLETIRTGIHGGFHVGKRSGSTVGPRRSLFVDIDLKGTTYADTSDAATALAAFVQVSGMPKPSAVVQSGSGGLHAYWTAEEGELPADDWHRMAQALKALCASEGLRIDATVTTDAARILRLPGSLNYKSGLPAKVTAHLGRRIPLDTLREALPTCGGPAVTRAGNRRVVDMGALVQRDGGVVDNSDLTSGAPEVPRPSIDAVAAVCPAVADAVATGGRAHAEPAWFAMLAVAAECSDPTDAAVRMSNQHPGYAPEVLSAKLAHVQAGRQGWIGCAAIADRCGRGKCAICPNFSMGKSPLNFARAVHDVELCGAGEAPSGQNAPETATGGSVVQVLEWDLTAQKALKNTRHNAKLATQSLSLSVRLDTFADRILIDNIHGSHALPVEFTGKLGNHAEAHIRDSVRRRFGLETSKEHMHDALVELAVRSRFNPVTDWLDLTWDGVGRLANWLPEVSGCDRSRLNRWAGAATVLAMVARAFHPGTKYDICVVLEGPQGSLKSSLVRALASGPGEGYFTDTPEIISMDAKQRGELVAGRWVVELPELSGLQRREVESVKAALTQTHDQYRPAYAVNAVDRGRTFVFIGTTNDSRYLRDDTGNRRFLPVRIKKIHLHAFMDIRQQLFAEGVEVLSRRVARWERARRAEVQRGSPLPYDLAERLLALPPSLRTAHAAASTERVVVDPVEDAVRAYMLGPTARRHLPDGREFISSADIAAGVHGQTGRVPNGRIVSRVMKDMGWIEAKHGLRTAGRDERVRGYAR